MATGGFRFPKVEFTAELRALQQEVRGFLTEERASGGFTPVGDGWGFGVDLDFSRKLGQRGWLGMTWPKQYGGHERSSMERYVVTEELLAAGAPVSAHWVADRQSGPMLLKNGTEAQKLDILPRIAAGECFFAIGMSEPDSGSDLASLRTTATKVDGGYKINGTKIWSSGAHFCHYMIATVRTGGARDDKNRHEGLSQFLVDLKTPGIDIRGIQNMAGDVHFNETVFEDAFVTEDCLLGEEGDGWHQVTSELGLERSGPERFLSSAITLTEAARRIGENPDDSQALALGQVTARLKAMRRMSLGVSALLQEGESPTVEAALVKDLGTKFESSLLNDMRQLMPTEPIGQSSDVYARTMAEGLLRVPSSTIRGGTNEVLRSIVARQLGLR
ncbi:MAG: acyl-CoA dehydrogenase family protein [Alphaproteobacteria bacterium]